MGNKLASQLFAGEAGGFGGLSNERELVKLCPPEFKRHNPWSAYAHQFIVKGIDTSNWMWKSMNIMEHEHKNRCLQSLIESFDIAHEDKEAVVCWMLSEMFVEVLKHLPLGKD